MEEPQVTQTTEVKGPLVSHHVPVWQISMFAMVAIVAWIGISFWVLDHNPTEAERASIQKAAELFATAAFFYFLGSSAGSRNRSPP